MQKRSKVVLSVLLLIASAGLVSAQIFSNGTASSITGDVTLHNVDSELITDTYAGFWGSASGTESLKDSEGVVFTDFGGQQIPNAVLLTTNSETLEGKTFVGLNETERDNLNLNAFDQSENLFIENLCNVTAFYKETEGGIKTYLLKIVSEATTLDDIVFVVPAGVLTCYNSQSCNYQALILGGYDYYFSSV